MNRATAFAQPTMNGYVGRFRLAWKTEAFPVRTTRDGPIVYFRTAPEAECAAWRVKDKIEQTVMHRDGETLSSAKAAADSYFRTGKANGKAQETN